MYRCLNCGRPYPPIGLPHVCPVCGGLYDDEGVWTFDPTAMDESAPGLWRYRHTFDLPSEQLPVSLGEGRTPLVDVRLRGRKVYFKCEYLNPTGSFKDRGSALLIAWAQSRGVSDIVEDSSGNAGASLAAYATQVGMRTRIFVPVTASGPKRRQIEMYGAEVVAVEGARSAATEAAQRAAIQGSAYLSHALLPFNLRGYATVAYEIWEQLQGRLPGAVIVPVGQGGLLLGLARGFRALLPLPPPALRRWRFWAHPKEQNRTPTLPRLIGVQAQACAPLWALFTAGLEGWRFVAENPTLAEGVRVRSPIRAQAVLQAVQASRGMFVAVDEEAILPGREALYRLGFEVEPTSALVWDALLQTLPDLPDPVVVILTGAGWKYEG